MIMNMERKLNSNGWGWLRYISRRDQRMCKLSTSQYWDLLTYLDDDYLSDFEIVKMKELYRQQLAELSGQFVAHSLVGYGMALLLMGPRLKSPAHIWAFRLPAALTFASFLGVQAAEWERTSPQFHDLIC